MTVKDNAKLIPNKVIVIDSDPASAANTEQLLLSAGVLHVEVFSQSDKGLIAIRSGEFDAAVLDWNLKGSVPCIAVLNRIRRTHEQVYFPMIVTTGIVKRDELRMIQDFQCIRILEKPLRQQAATEGLRTTVSEQRWYVSNEKRIAEAFALVPGDPKAALSTISRIIQNSPNPAPLAIIAGRHLANMKFYLQAQSIYDDILRRDPKHLQALNAKARLMAKMGRKKEALAVLMRAQELSPKSIDRLGLMGDLEISLRHPQAAIEHFQSALGLDSKDLKSKVGLKVAQNYSVVVDLQAGGTRDEPSVAKLINNLGVQLSHRGEFEKALKYYLISFAFMANDDLQSKVSFNLGLGFKKWGKPSQAKYWLMRAVSLAGGTYIKAERHLVGMEHVAPAAGLPGAPMAAPVPIINAPSEETLTPISATKKVISLPTKTKAAVADPTPTPDTSVFEEETMYGAPPKKSEALVQASLDKMIEDIDVDLSGLEQLTFDEAI